MQPERRASWPVLGSQAIKPSTSLAVLIARLLHARYMDQCRRRLNTTTSRHASAPQSPAVKAAANAGGRSEASALRRATRVWRRFLFRLVSFGEQAHGLLILRILAVPEKGLRCASGTSTDLARNRRQPSWQESGKFAHFRSAHHFSSTWALKSCRGVRHEYVS